MKKFKYSAVALCALFLLVVIPTYVYMQSGSYNRHVAQLTGYSKICVDGVQYLQFISGAAVQVDLNGRPVSCK